MSNTDNTENDNFSVLFSGTIRSYNDVFSIIKQQPILSEAYERSELFRIQRLEEIRHLLFAYFLGIIVGDASKPTEKFNPHTRRIGLTLTKKHIENERLGEFVCFCANSLGLKMGRIKDLRKGKRNVYPFYRWNSQKTQLVQWVFNKCLGLSNDQVTTYDPIKLNWILDGPNDFKIWFLQGLADSDGYVDIGVAQVGIIAEPNVDLVEKIFHSLGIHTSTKYLENMTLGTLMISVKDAYKLPIFSPYVKSHRYKLVEKIAQSDRIIGHWPKWLVDKIEFYLGSGLSETQVILKILNECKIFIHRKNLHKRRVKLLEVSRYT